MSVYVTNMFDDDCEIDNFDFSSFVVSKVRKDNTFTVISNKKEESFHGL